MNGYSESEVVIFRQLMAAELDFLNKAKDGNWHSSVQAAKDGRSERRDVHAFAKHQIGRIGGLPEAVKATTLDRYLSWLRHTHMDAKFRRFE